jgi:hypothetical protein
MNPFERAARAEKASKLAAAIDASRLNPTAAEVRTWQDETWRILSEIAQVPEPSELTREAVARLLEKREALLKPIRVLGARSKSSQVVELRAVSLARHKAPDPFAPAARSRARRELCKPGAVRWGAP